MPEGDDIPSELKHDVKSVSAVKEEARREFQADVTAHRLGIPNESMRQPLVHRYVNLARDVTALRDGLRPDPRDATEWWRRAGKQEQAREDRVCLLLDAASIMLGAGLDQEQPGVDRTSELATTLDAFGRAYELRASVAADRDRAVWQPAIGLWSGRGDKQLPTPPWQDQGGLTWWQSPDDPNDRHAGRGWEFFLKQYEVLDELAGQSIDNSWHVRTPNEFGNGSTEATYDRWRAELLASRVLFARRLQEETTNVSELAAVPGLHPAAERRLADVGLLADLMVTLFTRNFREVALPTDAVQTTLERVGADYGVRISRRPRFVKPWSRR